jgi:hypothetical protein
VVIAAIGAVLGLSLAATAFASPETARTASARAAGVPKCTAGNLGVWLAVDQGNGAAGTIYYPLQFTNLSGHACSLTGNPGVSVLSRSGHQLGSPANWAIKSGAHTVVLQPGQTAHTILAYHDVAVSTAPGCAPVKDAVALSVIPPDQRTATHAAFALTACSKPGVIYLTVTEPIRPGVGTING